MSRIRFLSALAALALSASACAGGGIHPAQFGSGDASWMGSRVSHVPVSFGRSATLAAPGRGTVSAALDRITRSRLKQTATPLSVTIYGSSTAESGDYQCYFWAVASGGTGSGYSYSWYSIGGYGSGSGDSWTGGGTGDFTVYVTVTDSGSGQAQDSFFVDVVAPNSAAQCFH